MAEYQTAQAWVPELTFGARLALVRHRMGWNIKEAALACGLPGQSWRGWEVQGHLPRDIRQIGRRIAARTGVDYDWLMEDIRVTHAYPSSRRSMQPAPGRSQVSDTAGRRPPIAPPGRPSTDRRPAAGPTGRRTHRLTPTLAA